MCDGMIIGIDIGGTNLRIGAVDGQGMLRVFEKQSSKQVFASDDSVTDLERFIEEFIINHSLTNVRAIALGVPATINRERTVVLNAPNVRGMNNAQIVKRLSKKFKLPIYLDKDVVMLFYHDILSNHLSLEGIVIGCYIGTGIGNVIAVNEQVLQGADGVAGELGHIPVLGRKEQCNCGNLGCLENYASGRGLEQLVQHEFAECPIGDIFTNHGKDARILEFVDTLAISIATEINILNPDLIILGGGVLSMPDFPQILLEQSVLKYARKPLPSEQLHIVYAVDVPESGVLGAAYYAEECLAKEKRELCG